MSTPIAIVEVVIHTDYGGFSINTEMALWLMENRGWTVAPKNADPAGHQLGESIGDYFFSTEKDEVKLRTNKDLIDCVRAIKEIHKDDVYPERYYGYIHKLKCVLILKNITMARNELAVTQGKSDEVSYFDVGILHDGLCWLYGQADIGCSHRKSDQDDEGTSGD